MQLPLISGAETNYCLSCVIAGQSFAVRLGPVRQILLRPHLVELESPPDDVIGLVTWQGSVIPVLKVCRKLILPIPVPREVKLVLVVDMGSELAGIVVDEITGVFRQGGTPEVPPRLQKGLAVNLGGLCGLVTPEGDVQSIWELDIPALCNFTTPVATAYEPLKTIGVAGFDARPERDLFVTFSVDNLEYALRLACLSRLIQGRRAKGTHGHPGGATGTISDLSNTIAFLDLPTLLAAKPPSEAVDKVSNVTMCSAVVAEDGSIVGDDPQKSNPVNALQRAPRWPAREFFLRARERVAPPIEAGPPKPVPKPEREKGKAETLLVLEREMKAIGIAADRVTGLIRGAKGTVSFKEGGVLLVKSSQNGHPIRLLDEGALLAAAGQITVADDSGAAADGRATLKRELEAPC